MTKLMLVGVAALLTGCATTAGGGAEDFGTIATRTMRAHVKAVRDHVRADRAAIKAAFHDAFGYRGTVVERSYSAHTAATHRSDSALQPAPTTLIAPYRDARERPIDVEQMQSIEMDVVPAEMLTPQGTLHPRAASALARMNAMARENGGDFSVAVPRSQLHTTAAIQAVAPGATIVATDENDFRLIVVAPDR